jgi:hypothetical protein
VASNTSIGTGANKRTLGKESHRTATAGCDNGVQKLTMAIVASTIIVTGRARSFIRCCSAPSVFITSQVEPSSA